MVLASSRARCYGWGLHLALIQLFIFIESNYPLHFMIVLFKQEIRPLSIDFRRGTTARTETETETKCRILQRNGSAELTESTKRSIGC